MVSGNLFVRLLVAGAAVAFCVLEFARAAQEAGGDATAPAPERFDTQVREQFFNGLRGDRASFEKAMQLCEARLKANSKDPEALVWHGAGLCFLGGQAYSAGDAAKGVELRKRGAAEMDEAVALRPHVETLVPRATTLLSAAQRISMPEVRTALLRKAVGDLEEVLAQDGNNFEHRCTHDRGELLGALAEGWSQLGDRPRTNLYLARLTKELPGTGYAREAQRMIDHPDIALTGVRLTCRGCHAGQ